jgi:hypothetical protein
MSNTINYSSVSKPFIITAVVLLFLGSFVGLVWMMSISGTWQLFPQWLYGLSFRIHKTLQMDGFLTLLIMGIGYMIIPRFRNIQLSSVKLAYLSFVLVLFPLFCMLVIQTAALMENGSANNFLSTAMMILRLSGVIIFLVMVLLALRVRPKLLGLSDYFIALSVVNLVIVNLIELLSLYGYAHTNSLTHIQYWLLFPILMIYGIEYKTLPSFLGFIRPRKTLGIISLIVALISTVLGLASIIIPTDILALPIFFNVVLLVSSLLFASSLYAFGGFDNSEILRLIQGEKKARYHFTVVHIKLSFLFLFIGITMSILFTLVGHQHPEQQYYFIFYDLAIHTIAIGFIGITIALYLPLMLPPIVGRIMDFTNFNKIPLFLIIASLVIRAIGDFFVPMQTSFSYFRDDIISFLVHNMLTYCLGFSGCLVIVSMLIFVLMLHRSMKEINPLPRESSSPDK